MLSGSYLLLLIYLTDVFQHIAAPALQLDNRPQPYQEAGSQASAAGHAWCLPV